MKIQYKNKKGNFEDVLNLHYGIIDDVIELVPETSWFEEAKKVVNVNPKYEDAKKSWMNMNAPILQKLKTMSQNAHQANDYQWKMTEKETSDFTDQYKMEYSFNGKWKKFGDLTINERANGSLGHIKLTPMMKNVMQSIEKKTEIMSDRVNTWIDRAKMVKDLALFVVTTTMTLGAGAVLQVDTLKHICKAFGFVSGIAKQTGKLVTGFGLNKSISLLNANPLDNPIMKTLSEVKAWTSKFA